MNLFAVRTESYFSQHSVNLGLLSGLLSVLLVKLRISFCVACESVINRADNFEMIFSGLESRTDR